MNERKWPLGLIAKERYDRLLYFAFQPVRVLSFGRLFMTQCKQSPHNPFSWHLFESMAPKRDWYRYEEWDDKIEREFFARLNRARSQRDQYLAIQALTLAETHPEVSIRLAQHYFKTRTGDFNDSRVLAAQGNAYRALGNTRDALASYQAALDRQREFPNLVAVSGTAVAYYIATEKLSDQYELALSLLENESEGSIWPVTVFSWNAAMALLLSAKGNTDVARRYSLGALEAASVSKTELSYHPELGTVEESFAPIIEQLKKIATKTDLQ